MAGAQKLGWIGMGRMGYPMAERLIKAGHDVSIWNRTKSKAEPLAAKGGKVVDKVGELAGVDVRVFHRLDRQGSGRSLFRPGRRVRRHGKVPKIVVDCSTIAVESPPTSASA